MAAESVYTETLYVYTETLYGSSPSGTSGTASSARRTSTCRFFALNWQLLSLGAAELVFAIGAFANR